MNISKTYKNINKHNLKNSYIFCLIYIISLFLRINNGYDSSIWLDEAWRIASARSLDLSSFITLWKHFFSIETLIIANDYFLKNSITNYRIIFVAVSSLAPPLLYLFSIRYLGKITSFIAAMVLAYSSWHITYSNELAAYAVGASLILIFSLLFFKEKQTKLNLLLIFLAILFLGLLHLYLLIFVLISIVVRYFIKFLIQKKPQIILNLFIQIFLILLLFSGQIYYLFFEFSNTGAFDQTVSKSWTILFPIYLFNNILPGPLSDRWIPTAYDVNIFTQFFSLAIFTIIIFSIINFFFFISSRVDAKNFKRYLKEYNQIISIFGIIIFFLIFIYLQAFLVNGEFYRYLLPIFPLLIFIIFYILENLLKTKLNYLYAIGCAFLFLNVSVITNSDFRTHFKNPYEKIFSEIANECIQNRTLVVSPSFLELAIVKFYLDDSSCSIVTQPSYEKFFSLHQKELAWQNELEMDIEDSYLLNKAFSDNDYEYVLIVGARSEHRIEKILNDKNLIDYKVEYDKTTSVKPFFRSVLIKKIQHD